MNTDLWQHFADARWFAGKGRGGHCTAIVPLDWYGPSPAEAPLAVRSEIATITYPDDSTEYYQLLVSYRPEPLAEGVLGDAPDPELGWAHEATKDPEALRLMITEVVAQGDRAGTWNAVMHRYDTLDGDIRVFTGEQSNTNLMIGTTALYKVFRKLEAGRNLDIAVHDALGRVGVHVAAKLHGWVEGRVPGVLSTDLAMVVEQFQDVHDGWDLFTRAAADQTDFTEHAAAIGRAIAKVHLALADTFPASRIQGAHVADTMARRLDAAVDAAPVLAEYAPRLRELFEGLRSSTLNTQQVHGDFHLGQVVLTSNGWRIIDFEGEPMKTLEERRLPDSKWRDIAGMLRSFSYATSGADDPTAPEVRAWQQALSDAFLAAYAPALTEEQQRILDAYVADKAIYELVYEVRNRPTWVEIPLGGIRQLTDDSSERN